MGAFCCRARRAYEPGSDEELLSWEGRGCGHQCLNCGERPCISANGRGTWATGVPLALCVGTWTGTTLEHAQALAAAGGC